MSLRAPRTRGEAISVESALLALILGATLIRLAFAWSLGLGVDESYMVASGRVLSLGYFDHPPASWWLAWGAAHLFDSEAPIVVRLPFIALFALSTLLIYRLGAAIAGKRAGLWAAVLLNLSPVFGVTTGTWVLPDGPLDCALLGAALCLLRALERGTLLWWLGAGLCAGLALFSKYSAILTIAGALLYLATTPQDRRWLLRPAPWLAVLVAALIFVPVLYWNATHGWESFAFQGGRASATHVRPFAPFITLLGESVFILPWIWLPLMIVFVSALRRDEWRPRLLACLAVPPIVLFALISAWSSQRVLYHWAAPGYLMLFPLLGDAVARRIAQPAVRQTLFGTACFVVLGVATVATQVRFDWLYPLIAAVSRHDPDLDAIDWTSLRDDLIARDLLHPGSIVGVPNWRDAGKIAYAFGPHVTTLCLSSDARQFGIAFPVGDYLGADILILAPDHPERVPRALGASFDYLERLPDSAISHQHLEEPVAVFRGNVLRHWPPSE